MAAFILDSPGSIFRYRAIKGWGSSAVKVKQYQFVETAPNSGYFPYFSIASIIPEAFYTTLTSLFWTWFSLFWEKFDIMRKKEKETLSWRLDFQNRWFKTNSLRNLLSSQIPLQVTLPDDKKNETARKTCRRILTNEFLPTVCQPVAFRLERFLSIMIEALPLF